KHPKKEEDKIMSTDSSEIQISRLGAIVLCDSTSLNRGWEGGLTPLQKLSEAPALNRSTVPRLTPILLVLLILSALSTAATQKANQPPVSLPVRENIREFNLRLATCNHHRTFNFQPSTFNQHGMGFDKDKATHHFRLMSKGGAIEVQANDAGDTATRDEIRTHLNHIAEAFKAGDFSIPMFVHDETPPGVETMKQLKLDITYKYEETDRGGRVTISTTDPRALDAIHSFLRYQIREH